MVKFKGKFVSIKQDKPFEEKRGVGMMKQKFP